LDKFVSGKRMISKILAIKWGTRAKMWFAKLKYTIIACFLFTVATNAQEPIYSQYMMNAFLLNPAVAGHEGYTAVNLTVRDQWAGNGKDSPKTYALSAQTRWLKNSFIFRSKSIRHRRKSMSRGGKVGIGGYVFNDVNGAFSKSGIQGTYAYHLTLRRSQLSFGGSVKVFQYKLDKSKIKLGEEDEFFNLTQSKVVNADANAGVYYSDRNLYAGLSVQNIFQSFSWLNNRPGAGFQLFRQYIMTAGYRFDVMDFIFLEPSFLFKFTENNISQTDLNVKLYYKEDYWGGISYRTGSSSAVSKESLNGKGSSIIFMVGARVDKFYFGYSFDYTFSSYSKTTFGSHEIILAVKFGDNARRYRWLNRY
jgi:type IX secretion system PorP/SprF family membrane protein